MMYEIPISRKREIKSDTDRKPKVTPMGNIPGDTVGKYFLKDRKSTRSVLGDILGKSKSDRLGNGFSPGKQGLRESLLFWSMKGVSGDRLGN